MVFDATDLIITKPSNTFFFVAKIIDESASASIKVEIHFMKSGSIFIFVQYSRTCGCFLQKIIQIIFDLNIIVVQSVVILKIVDQLLNYLVPNCSLYTQKCGYYVLNL